jgi:hypothetical protein
MDHSGRIEAEILKPLLSTARHFGGTFDRARHFFDGGFGRAL